jgi:transposase
MSTSLLYHACGVRGHYQLHRTDFVFGRICFWVEQPRAKHRCSACGSAAVNAQGHKERFLRSVPIGLKPTFLVVKVPRVVCFQCELTRQIKVPFADPRRSYTHAFERYALELMKFTTIQDAALHLDVSWDIAKDIQKRNLHRRFAKPKLKKLKEIAIDEVAVGKGHRYFTLVMDLRSGAVVYVGNGKGVAALTGFWKRLRASRAKIRAVATDMGKPYIRAVRDHLPNAVHVFDHSTSSNSTTTNSAPCVATSIANSPTTANANSSRAPVGSCSRTPRTSTPPATNSSALTTPCGSTRR